MNDLAAARERLRKHRDAETYRTSPYWLPGQRILDVATQERDRDLIVAHDLAETPPDDVEPVTAEWLQKEGFREYCDPGWLQWGKVLLLDDDGKGKVAWIRPCAVYDLRTRGDVRALCAGLKQPLAALGVQGKEQG